MIRIANIDFLTVQETAKALGVTPQTVRAYIKQGRIKGNRIGKPILIRSFPLILFPITLRLKTASNDIIHFL